MIREPPQHEANVAFLEPLRDIWNALPEKAVVSKVGMGVIRHGREEYDCRLSQRVGRLNRDVQGRVVQCPLRPLHPVDDAFACRVGRSCAPHRYTSVAGEAVQIVHRSLEHLNMETEPCSNRGASLEEYMVIPLRTIAVCLTLLALTSLIFAGSAPSVGSQAPEFTLNSQEGTPVSLKDYRGKWVVLYFYPKDFTSGCTIEAHNFQRDLAQYQQKNVVILGVSVDSADSHKQFCAKEGLNFKLLADTDHKVSSAYDSLTNFGLLKVASRHTFIINPEGKVAKAFTEVNPNQHSAEVLAALADLQK